MAGISSGNRTMLTNTSISNSSASMHPPINFTFMNSHITLTNFSLDATYSALPVAAKYACYTLYVLELFFGTLENILVFYVIGYRKKKRNSGDIYMLSLAFADLLGSLVAPLAQLSDLSTDFPVWIYGEMLCYVMPTSVPITMCASAWTLVLISVDRLRIISKPMTWNRRRTWLYGSSAAVWLLSVVITIPCILRIHLVQNYCIPTNSKIVNDKDFVIFTGIFVFYNWFIPSLSMMFVYYFTARSLKASSLKHENSRAMEQRNRQNAKAVKMLAVVVIVFFLLTVPYGVFYFFAIYMHTYKRTSVDVTLYYTLNHIVFVAASANGCVNPLIYAKMHREMNRYVREVLQQIARFLCKCCYKESKSTYDPSSASTEKTD